MPYKCGKFSGRKKFCAKILPKANNQLLLRLYQELRYELIGIMSRNAYQIRMPISGPNLRAS